MSSLPCRVRLPTSSGIQPTGLPYTSHTVSLIHHDRRRSLPRGGVPQQLLRPRPPSTAPLLRGKDSPTGPYTCNVITAADEPTKALIKKMFFFLLKMGNFIPFRSKLY